jgi:hypothetical protein
LEDTESQLLTNLVRENLALGNQKDSVAEGNKISCEQNRDVVIEIQEYNPSLAEQIVNSVKIRKLPVKDANLDLLKDESTHNPSKSMPLKVVKLKLSANKEIGGKIKHYSKQDLEKVTTTILKAVNEIQGIGKSALPSAANKETVTHDKFQTGMACSSKVGTMEVMQSSTMNDNSESCRSIAKNEPDVDSITDVIEVTPTFQIRNSSIKGIENSNE